MGKISIIATEMLESMTNSIRPTRAEVSDVANGIYEMATAIMLSGETAVGKYPIYTTKTMSKIVFETEKHINYNKLFFDTHKKSLSLADSISQSTCTSAINLKAKAIFVYTNLGNSANLIARHRINVPIVAITRNPQTFHSLALSWNVMPYFEEKTFSEEEMIEYAKLLAKKLNLAKNKDIIIVQTGKDDQCSNCLKAIRL